MRQHYAVMDRHSFQEHAGTLACRQCLYDPYLQLPKRSAQPRQLIRCRKARLPPGGTRVLRIGARIVHNERIRTTKYGTVQILFIDKTTLNIGPNSVLVIDKFAYNPADSTGEMVTTLAKGVLRFVGGILSHRGAAPVNTPVSAIGVRGGIATIMQSKNGARAINDFGQLSSTNGCGTVIIRRAEFAISIPDWNSCPTAPERVSQSEVNRYLALLTSKPGQTDGAPLFPLRLLSANSG